MNNNEAISQIRFLLYVDESDGFTRLEKEALNMAISALSAEITATPTASGR